jgi:hypothetical protein
MTLLDMLTHALRPAAILVSLGAGGCFWTIEDDADEPSADSGGEDDGDDAGGDDEGGDAEGGDDDGGDADETGDGGGVLDCDASWELEGVVSGVDAAFDGYWVDTTFYNTSLEEVVLSEIDFELMEAMGLDPEDPEDQDRFKWFSAGFELRNLYTEYLDEYHFEGFLPKTGRDLSIAFFDLAESEVQPGTAVAVFDVSAIEPPRDADDLDALGAILRELIDEMRGNGQPDAVITFAPDRSDETIGEAIWIAMLSQSGRFASSGTATFHSLVDELGEPMAELAYPNVGIGAVSISVDAAFGDGESLQLDAACLPALISG